MGKRVAVIYDIHGNDTALEAVLDEIKLQMVDLILVGGDLAWGPEPRQVMNRCAAANVRRSGVPFAEEFASHILNPPA